MEPQIEAPSSSRYDSLLLFGSAVLLVGGMFAFYWLTGEINAAIRLLILLAALGGSVALAYRTQMGQAVWATVLGSRTELRKVVWPSRQESLQATLMIAVVVLITSLLLWGLDSLLLFGVKSLTGRG
ncbi:preprotein translocase subunit SecE [Hydrocarboniphaga daqingensis]|uniref:Preprotein translocase subunit SecE n=1 Tax=Hydrocarboniphaga daqingensis TaxID=490188 RepID=A0A1M5SBP8_9GAMM|nr:preprotein translocase subunit SecE [Hydrocarboniphaga daqingensis]SHH35936.1 preprotein translocase subunit SecE [Hydrocarboniphaga daqingensis]